VITTRTIDEGPGDFSRVFRDSLTAVKSITTELHQQNQNKKSFKTITADSSLLNSLELTVNSWPEKFPTHGVHGWNMMRLNIAVIN